MKNIEQTCLLFLGLMIFYSCSNDSSSQEEESAQLTEVDSVESETEIDELTQFKYDKLIGNIPIPFDILHVHASVPLKYNPGVLNPTSNLSLYSSNASKALNLGVYGGDLAYSITYEKFDDMGAYLKCAKTLADDLGIPIAFDQQALATYKQFETNKDSLEHIVFNSFSEVDKTLKSNERIGLAALVVTGGWIEGLHGTLQSLNDEPRNAKSSAIYQKIWEQKNNLDMLMSLLKQFEDKQEYASLLKDFSSIQMVYSGLADPDTISEGEMANLKSVVAEVRDRIVSQ